MNKLTIPTILVATVMVAGIFAFMPIEQASTVHTTIQDTQAQVRSLALASVAITTAADGVGTLTCNQPYMVNSVNWVTIHDNASDDYAIPAITVDGETVQGISLPGEPGADADVTLNLVVNAGAATGTNTVLTQDKTANGGVDGVAADTVSFIVTFTTTNSATCTLT